MNRQERKRRLAPMAALTISASLGFWSSAIANNQQAAPLSPPGQPGDTAYWGRQFGQFMQSFQNQVQSGQQTATDSMTNNNPGQANPPRVSGREGSGSYIQQVPQAPGVAPPSGVQPPRRGTAHQAPVQQQRQAPQHHVPLYDPWGAQYWQRSTPYDGYPPGDPYLDHGFARQGEWHDPQWNSDSVGAPWRRPGRSHHPYDDYDPYYHDDRSRPPVWDDPYPAQRYDRYDDNVPFQEMMRENPRWLPW